MHLAFLRLAVAGVVVGIVTGCQTLPDAREPMVMEARYAPAAVNIDGKLDDAVWQTATAYPMLLPGDTPARYAPWLREAMGPALREGGKVRFAWNDDWFYVGAVFEDSDLVAEGEEDQLHHYSMGDLLEVFIKPESSSWYWELYATPHNRQTSFFFPSQGRKGLPSNFNKAYCPLRVAATLDGSLNDWKDRDAGWTVEMAIPVSAITEHGDAWGTGSRWRVLAARYNYSCYLPIVELSATPRLERTDFHWLPDYGRIEFVK